MCMCPFTQRNLLNCMYIHPASVLRCELEIRMKSQQPHAVSAGSHLHISFFPHQLENSYAVLLWLGAKNCFWYFCALKIVRQERPKLLTGRCKALVFCQEYGACSSGHPADALQQRLHCLGHIHLPQKSRLANAVLASSRAADPLKHPLKQRC